jgi:hypothetical protein
MPVAGGGFEQCYNAQAVVAAESLLVIAVDVVQAPLEKVDALPQRLGRPETLLADSGCFSGANVMACTALQGGDPFPPRRLCGVRWC